MSNKVFNFNKRSLRYKTVSAFLLFTVLILGVLWVFQLLLYNSLYSSMKNKEVKKATEKIVSAYGKTDYALYVNKIAFENDLTLYVFKVLDGDGKYVLYSGGRGAENPGVLPDERLTDFVTVASGSDGKIISYVQKMSGGSSVLTCGTAKTINGEMVYFYVNCFVQPVKSTSKVLTVQLLTATLLSVLLALGLSLYYGKKLSYPLTKLTASAQTLADGDLNAKFEAKGYAEAETLASTLNYATEEIIKTDRLRKDLISNVSHEIRTPLTIIKAYAEMMRDITGDDKEKRTEQLNTILQETERLNRLVNDFLGLSKLQAGVVTLDKKDFSLSELADQRANYYANSYPDFVIKKDMIPNVTVFGDRDKIEQVLDNLLANAVNYSGDIKEIGVALKRSDNKIVLEVSDKGVGIPEQDIPYIFDKFFRSGETSRNTVGSGIGLSIVKEILTLHGFDFGVKSKVGEGSTFYVIFEDGIN